MFAFYAERLEKSSVFHKMDTTKLEIDTANIFKSWCTFLETRKIQFSEVVTTQFVHETGFFTSSVYQNCNNPSGMKMNKRGIAKKVCEGHAYYNTVLDAIEDYRLYQSRMLYLARQQGRPCETNEDYFALLEDLPHLRGHRYAQDPKYIDKLKARMAYMKNL